MNPMNRLRPTAPANRPADGPAPPRQQRRRARPTWRATARSMVVLALAASLLAPLPAAAQQDPNDEPDDQTAIEPETTEPTTTEPTTTEPTTTEPAVTAPAAPVFTAGASVTLTIAEDHADGASVGTVDATDANDDTLTYSLSGTDAASFALNAATGEISVASGVTLDFETQSSHSITVGVSDGVDADGNAETGTATVDATIEVTIEVTDVAEDEPNNEDEPGDGQPGDGQPQGQPGDGQPGDEGETGNNDVQACNGDPTAGSGTATVPTAPVFTAGASVTLSIAEDHADGAAVGIVEATDANGDTLTYSLSGTDAASFELDTATGEICVASGVTLDFETQSSHAVTVGVSDGIDADGNPETGTATVDATIEVTIEVTDAPEDQTGDEGDTGNEQGETTEPQTTAPAAPVFTDGASVTLNIGEDHTDGASVGFVAATDADGDTLTYSLSGTDAASFALDTATGEITVASGITLDFETQSSHSVTVGVSDGMHADGSPELGAVTVDATIEVTIEVIDAPEDQTGDGPIGDGLAGDGERSTAQGGPRGAQGDGATGATVPDVDSNCGADWTTIHNNFESVTATATLISVKFADPITGFASAPAFHVCGPHGPVQDGEPTYTWQANGHVTFSTASAGKTFGIFSLDELDSWQSLLKPDAEYWVRTKSGYSGSQRGTAWTYVRTLAGTADPPTGCGTRVAADLANTFLSPFVQSLSVDGAQITASWRTTDSVSLELCDGMGRKAVIDDDLNSPNSTGGGVVTITEADFTADSTDNATALAVGADYWLRIVGDLGANDNRNYVWHYIRTAEASAAPTAPVFSAARLDLSVAESLGAGGSVGTVTATDANNDTLEYRLVAVALNPDDVASFVIDSGTGAITLAADASLDFETKNAYSFRVQVSDRKAADGTDETTYVADAALLVVVSVTDVNDIVLTLKDSSNDAISSLGEAAGSTAITVTATLEDGNHGSALSVTLSLDGTATSGTGNDYTASGTLSITIPANTASATTTINIDPLEDDDFVSETILVTGTVADFEVRPATLTLTDNDQPEITLSLLDSSNAALSSLSEAAGSTTVKVKATRDTSESSGAVNVALALDSTSTAMRGDDYSGPQNLPTISLAAGVASATATITIDPLEDDDATSETLVFGGTASGHTVTTATLTINDDDSPATSVTITATAGGSGEIAENTSGAQTVTITATLDGASLGSDVVVTFSALGGTATRGADASTGDYTSSKETPDAVTISSGDLSASTTITVTPRDDNLDEGTGETITFDATLSGGLTSTTTDSKVTAATLTITDNDATPSTIKLVATPSSVGEGDSAATQISVKAQWVGSSTRTVDTVVTLGSSFTGGATKDTDYTISTALSATTITIPAEASESATNPTFSVTPTQDTDSEGPETIELGGTACLSTPAMGDPCPTADVLTVNNAVVNLVDDDLPVMTLTVSPTSLSEEAGSTSVTVTATRPASAAGAAVSVTLAVDATSTAVSPGDYAALGTLPTISLLANEQSKSVSFNIDPADDTDSVSETIVFGGTAEGYSVQTATFTINDQDAASTSVTITAKTASDATAISESISGGALVTVTATLDGGTLGSDVTVTFSTLGGTATRGAPVGNDYIAFDTNDNEVTKPATITIAMGDQTASTTIEIDPIADFLDEGAGETIIFDATLSGGLTGTGADKVTPATFTITDDDTASTTIDLSVDTDSTMDGEQTSIGEGHSETTVTVKATLDGSVAYPADTTVAVSVVTVTENAATPSADAMSGDYQLKKFDDSAVSNVTLPISLGNITIPAGQTSATATFKITPNNDDTSESTETIRVDGALTDFTVNHADISLEDNDLPPLTLTTATTSIAEGGGPQTVHLSAGLDSNAPAGGVTVNLTFGGTATKGTDYTVSPANPSITISGNFQVGLRSLTITPVNDRITEGDKTIVISGSHGDYEVQPVTITLSDDDSESTAVAIKLFSGTTELTDLSEAAAETTVTVKAELNDGTLGSGVTVTFADLSGSATRDTGSGGDYTAKNASNTAVSKPAALTIAAGQVEATTTIKIDPTDDDIDEGTGENIQFTATLGGALSGNATAATLRINDNDTAQKVVDLSVSPEEVSEGHTGEATVTVTATVKGTKSHNTATVVPVQVVAAPAGKRGADASLSSSSGDYQLKKFDNNAPSSVTLPIALGSITIPAGSTSATATFKIDPRDDADFEGTHADHHEYIGIGPGTGTVPTGFTVNGTDLEITENDNPGITITVDTDTVAGGIQTSVSEGTSSHSVRVTLTMDNGARGAATDVAISFAGTAMRGACSTSGKDYNAGTQSVQIPASSASRSFTLPISVCDDRLTEGAETIIINGTASGFDVSGATVTIDDDDAESTSLTISATPSPLAESDGSRTVTVKATLDGGTLGVNVTVTFNALSGGAVRGANANSGDYTSTPAKPAAITINANQLSAQTTITIDPRDDTIDENDETIVFGATATRTDNSNALTVTAGSITITDNDTAAVTIGVDTDTGTTGVQTAMGEDAGATTVRVKATLSTTRSTATEVTLRIDSGGTADLTDDYTVSSSLTDTTVDITIAAGSTSGTKDVTITPVEDRFNEGIGESVVIGATATDSLAVTAGTVTITDNDNVSTTVALSVDTDTGTMGDQAAIGEGDGATNVKVTATLNDAVRDSATAVTLTFAGTAVRDSTGDYTASGTLTVTIPANEVSGEETITITPRQERIDDGDKTIKIGGTPPSGSGLTITKASDITLSDDDDAPTQIRLTVTPEDVLERPVGGTTQDTEVTVTAEFTGTNSDVTLLTGTAVTLSVHSDSTAQRSTAATKPSGTTGWVSGDQYWAPAKLGDSTADITIAAGQTSATTTVVFTSRDENVNDNDKTIIIDATANNSFTVAAADRATIDFVDNDGPSTRLDLLVHVGTGDGRFARTTSIPEGRQQDVYITAELNGAASTSAINVTLAIPAALTAVDDTNCPGAEVGQYCDGRTPAVRGAGKDYTAAAALGDGTVDITIPANATSARAGPFTVAALVDSIDDGEAAHGPGIDNEVIRISATVDDTNITTVGHWDLDITDTETASTRIRLSRGSGLESFDEDRGADVDYTVVATLAGTVSRRDATEVTLSFGGTAAVGGVGATCTGDETTETLDYIVSPNPATVTIPAESLVSDATLVNVTLTPCNDDDVEGNEAIEVRGTATGFTVSDGFDVTVEDDELPVVTVTATRVPLVEGTEEADAANRSVDEGGTATFEITATRLLSQATTEVEVPLALLDSSSATPGDDYRALSSLGTITIPAGEESASRSVRVTVRTIEDRIREDGGETIKIGVTGDTLGDPPEYVVTPATITINDDDGPSDGFILSINRRSVSEAANATSVTVTAEVNKGAPTAEVTVTLDLGGVATKGTDYADPGTQTITIPANGLSGSVTFDIDPTEDRLDEGRGEPIEIGVASISSTDTEITLDQAEVTKAELTITDNDTASSVVTLTADVSEIDEPGDLDTDPVTATTVTITARLGSPTEQDPVLRGDAVVVTLDFGGTATADADYTVAYGNGVTITSDGLPTITIPAETLSATATLTITPEKDRIDERTGETIFLGGTAMARDVRLRLNHAVVNMTDNDDPSTRVTLSVSGGSSVGEDGAIQTVTVTAKLDDAARTTDTVVWLELGGGATAGDDYRVLAPQPVVVKIPAWVAEATATIVIDPLDDAIDEGAEAIRVSGRDARVSGLEVWLDGDTEDTKQEHLATGITITDNDTAESTIALSVDTARVREAGSSAAVRITATLDGTVARSTDTVVALTPLPDEPVGFRHSGLPASVTIPAGELSGSATGLRITATQDDDAADESIVIGGTACKTSNDPEATCPAGDAFTVNAASITVVDDDKLSTSVTLSVSPSSLREAVAAGRVTITATLDAAVMPSDSFIAVTVDGASTAERCTIDDLVGETPATHCSPDSWYAHPALGDTGQDIEILAGRRSGSVSFNVSVFDDMIDEGDGETIVLGGTVTASFSSTLTTVHGTTLTIADNDTASDVIELTAFERHDPTESENTLGEDDAQKTDFAVKATLRGDATRNVDTTVTLSTRGTAVRGTSGDYTLQDGPNVLATGITIPAGESEKTVIFEITPVQDTTLEGTEIIEIAGTAGDLKVLSTTISIVDDDVEVPDPPEVQKPARRPTAAALNWEAPPVETGADASPRPDGYVVQRRSAGGWWQDVTVIRANPDRYSFTDSPLDPATSYQWRVLSFVDVSPGSDERFIAPPETTELADSSSSSSSSSSGFFGGGGGGGGGGAGGGARDDECTGETSRYTFILANGWSPADISVAAALAARTPYAVVLYAASDELPRHVESLICKHQPRSVTVIGGSEALSGVVVRQVRDAAADTDIDRLRGATRIETAAAVAREVLGDPLRDVERTLVIANGWSAPDAGAAAAIAARTPNSAVLYTAAGSLPDATRDVIVDYKPARIIIVGGTVALSEAVEQAVAEAAASGVVIERVTGATRTDTAAAAARLVLGDPAKSARRIIVVANGWSPPDIGVAAALAARTSSTAMAYSSPDALDAVTAELIAGYKPSRIIIVGGTTAVPQAVRDALAAAAPGATVERVTGSTRTHTAANAANRTLG